MTARCLLIAIVLQTAAVPTLRAEPRTNITTEQVYSSMEKAMGFLLADQNEDGSWGSWDKPAHEFWSNPETHRSWIVATTALCCLAMSEIEQTKTTESAYDRGIDYILANALVKRPSDWDVDNNWAYVYALPALANAYTNPRYKNSARLSTIREVGHSVIKKLGQYQTPSGGWGYYDFVAYTSPPSWATSFMTAVGLLGLLDVREAGFDVPPDMIFQAARAIKRCKMPSGAYTYTVNAIADPRHSEWIDNVKGSLSRIQVCNLALQRAGEEISQADFKVGLDQFFKEHKFLDVARKRPIPHEAYYLNSGYFYFFGHYYGAQIIEQLPQEDQAHYWPMMRQHIMKTQEKDGSMWDFYFNTYGKPYGAAFGLMTLVRTVEPKAETAASSPTNTQMQN